MLLRRTNNANKTYDVQTMQTNFVRFAKKALVIKLDPPKDLEKSTRLVKEEVDRDLQQPFRWEIAQRQRVSLISSSQSCERAD